jgi:hypothetical protein
LQKQVDAYKSLDKKAIPEIEGNTHGKTGIHIKRT